MDPNGSGAKLLLQGPAGRRDKQRLAVAGWGRHQGGSSHLDRLLDGVFQARPSERTEVVDWRRKPLSATLWRPTYGRIATRAAHFPSRAMVAVSDPMPPDSNRDEIIRSLLLFVWLMVL